MKSFLLLSLFLLHSVGSLPKSSSRYEFFRVMEKDRPERNEEVETRRVFGGKPASLSAFSAIAALLDRYWITRCSCSVIAPKWVLTAAHCVTGRVAYIKYNSEHPSGPGRDSTPVLYLYRHPNYKVVQEDEGRGMDVTVLHHDLGLVRARDDMTLLLPMSPLAATVTVNPNDIINKELTVMGFGRTESSTRSSGEELFAVKLLMTSCERISWFHCMCGVAIKGSAPRGVCAGDSGGPVLYNGTLVGVTSMGPVECTLPRTTPSQDATSVFTTIFEYVELINTTISDADEEMFKAVVQYNSSPAFLTFKLFIPLVMLTILASIL